MSSLPDADNINRFLFDGTDIRGEIVTLETSYQELLSNQTIDQGLVPLFGEFLAGTSMLAEILKFDGTLTLQARGEGSLGLIMSEANSEGHLRGIVSCDDQQACFNDDARQLKPLQELIGNGVLAMTIDPKNGQRYQGIVPLEGASLSECLQNYFHQSEQVPTFVKLFANGDRCGGIFLQCLPPQEVLDPDERQEIWETTCQLANTMTEHEFFSVEHSTVLFRLFNEMDCRIFSAKPLSFRCHCSRKRSEKALMSLGADELRNLIQERGEIDIDCQFCGKNYNFTEQDIENLIKQRQSLH